MAIFIKLQLKLSSQLVW